ncbi:hypothetical protein CTEN210_06915 [Chaetoceros tenuissimus]|uniref:Uncharacterized protein n=1 Tax=Chaetoceros tenuissimus TaxID=426638 RepID=A0AAD3CRE5_9STRA|nr:hypothetical protein CTEN210_06915 [Chaetoceros tenuissimus]
MKINQEAMNISLFLEYQGSSNVYKFHHVEITEAIDTIDTLRLALGSTESGLELSHKLDSIQRYLQKQQMNGNKKSPSIKFIDLHIENELEIELSENTKINKNHDNICEMDIEVNSNKFNFGNSSPRWIWNTLLPQIIQISKHSDDKNYNWKRFTVDLLRIITPNLENCIQNVPTLQWQKIEEIIEIGFSRYQYIHGFKEFKTEPRTINIVILGGSVTKGVNCAAYPVHNLTANFAINSCNWYSRLNRMVNEIFGSKNGEGLFHIESIALGGTNTAIGTEAVRYNLLSTTDKVFDVVINAYSTNDVHVDTIKEAREKNLTLEDNLFQMEQDFIRTCLGENKPCKLRSSPLVIYYNDYVGNEQKSIIELDSFSSVIRKLTSYYGIGHLSYVDVVRHFVYADTTETWFSPDMWPNRNVHPGRGFHIITPWLFLYYGMNLISSYCNKKSIEHIFHGHSISKSFGYSPELPSEGMSVPKKILPVLDKNLNLDTISSKWNNSTSVSHLCRSEEPAYCRLSFIGSLPGASNQRQLATVKIGNTPK